jgi:uncharacterized protein (DUF1697 family)
MSNVQRVGLGTVVAMARPATRRDARDARDASPTAYAALLRGVNVGGHGAIKMEELRAAFVAFGVGDVTTYIQSGNVVFSSHVPVTAADLEQTIESAFGMKITVMVRTRAELRDIVGRYPFAGVDGSRRHVGFLTGAPAVAVAQGLDLQRFSPDEVVLDGREAFFHLPHGVGRSKLPDYVGRQLEVPMTIRNWNTVSKLIELVDLVTA